MIRNLLTILLALVLASILLGQCRKPRGWLGRFYIWLMNLRHAGVTKWGLDHLRIEPQFVVLDIGCGGGKAVSRMAALASNGKVHGVDYSAASVAAARSENSTAIAAGRVEIQEASVSRLPFADGTFDLVTAFETHYYWPDPASDVREIARVLKPGGRFAIVAETYGNQTLGPVMAVPMRLLQARYLSADEHRTLLENAGLTEVTVDTLPGKGWICAIGRK